MADDRFEHIYRWQRERIEQFYIDSQGRDRGDVVMVVMDLEDPRAYALAAAMSSFEDTAKQRQEARSRGDTFGLAVYDQTVVGAKNLFHDSSTLLVRIDDAIAKNQVPVVVMTNGRGKAFSMPKPDDTPTINEPS